MLGLPNGDIARTMKHRNVKKPTVRVHSKPKLKKLGITYYEEDFLKKKCPCKHKTSTPVKFGLDFDIYEDIIFVPVKDLTNKTHYAFSEKILSEAFIIASSKKDCFIYRNLKKAKNKSRKSAIKALTLILCNIL